MDFSRQTVVDAPFRVDRYLTDGSMSTSIYPRYFIDANPGSNQYLILDFGYDEDTFEVHQPTTNHDLYVRTDRCFDQEQIDIIFGADTFDVPEDQVVWLPGEHLWHGYDPNAIADWIDGEPITYAEEIEAFWGERLQTAELRTHDIVFQ